MPSADELAGTVVVLAAGTVVVAAAPADWSAAAAGRVGLGQCRLSLLGLGLGLGSGRGAGLGGGCCCRGRLLLGLGFFGRPLLGQPGLLGRLLGQVLLVLDLGHQGGDLAFHLGLKGDELVLGGLYLVAVLLQLCHLGGVGVAGYDELGTRRAGVGRGQAVAVLGIGLVRGESLFDLLAQQRIVEVGQGSVECHLRPTAHIGVHGVLLEQRHGLGLPGLRQREGPSGRPHPGIGQGKVGDTGVILLAQSGLLLAQGRDLVSQRLSLGAFVGKLAGTGRHHHRTDDGESSGKGQTQLSGVVPKMQCERCHNGLNVM